MYVERHVLELTTDALGKATAYTPVVTGRLLAIHYVKDAVNPFSEGWMVLVTAEATGETLWSTTGGPSASTVRRPRAPTHASDGSPSLYAAGGEPVEDAIVLANDRVEIYISDVAGLKKGTFHILIG
ncbi:unnamed protein product [marine sediment metagenome]|uniref:Uncharacterized protein n=1 Tax=marine sediment metagenome TaxID=412755 RepID=X1G5L9_9ZZZZ